MEAALPQRRFRIECGRSHKVRRKLRLEASVRCDHSLVTPVDRGVLRAIQAVRATAVRLNPFAASIKCTSGFTMMRAEGRASAAAHGVMRWAAPPERGRGDLPRSR